MRSSLQSTWTSPIHGNRRQTRCARLAHLEPLATLHRSISSGAIPSRLHASATGRERCTPWRGGWPLPTAGGRRRQRIANDAGDIRPCPSSAVASEDEEERTSWKSARLRLRE